MVKNAEYSEYLNGIGERNAFSKMCFCAKSSKGQKGDDYLRSMSNCLAGLTGSPSEAIPRPPNKPDSLVELVKDAVDTFPEQPSKLEDAETT